MITSGGTATLGLYDLKRKIDAFGGVDYFRPNLAGGYLKNARVMLTNGDIVKSTVDGNVNDPNVDMTGWVKTNSASQIVDESGLSQQKWNNGVESIAELLAIQNPKEGSRVFVKSYHVGLNKGGSDFICVQSTTLVENLVTVFRSKVVGYENFFYVRTGVDQLTVEHGGTKGDGVTDDTEAFQRTINTAPKIHNVQYGVGGLSIKCTSNQYYIAGTILVPAFILLDGQGATLIGNNKTNDCFHSAYWKNDSVLTDLVPEPLETANLFRTQICHFVTKNFNICYNLRGFTFGCMISDVLSVDCNQHINSVEHYFLRIERSKAERCTLGYKFSVFSGMLSFQTVTAGSCTNGFEFIGGAQAVNINNIAVEGATNRAVYIEGQGNTGGITVEHCYFEGDITTMVDYSTNTRGTCAIKNNFINIQTGTIAKNGANGICEVDNSNFIVSCGKFVDSSESTQAWNNTRQEPYQVNDFGLSPNSPNGLSLDKNAYNANRPDLWEGGNHYQRIMQRNASSGNFIALHDHYFGLIPATYYGNQGDAAPDRIPFCSHTKTVTETGKLNIVITTSIVSKEFVQGTFNLRIFSDTTSGVIASGRFYQNSIYFDANTHSLVGSVSTVNNVIVLTIAGLTGTGYQCRGFIKLI